MLETILGILITLVLVAIAVILSKLWPTFQALLPSWAVGMLTALADSFVRWVEKEHADVPGPKKFEIVLELLQEKLLAFHIHIDIDIIQAAIEAAWSKMNAEQVTAGIKRVA